MGIQKENQRDMVAAAFDYARQMALHALDNRHCTDMCFRLDFGVNRLPKIESNIGEHFLNDK